MTNDKETMAGLNELNGNVSLEMLAKMTGFPVEMIKEEIFPGSHEKSEISLEELRSAMLSFIDSTMLINDQK